MRRTSKCEPRLLPCGRNFFSFMTAKENNAQFYLTVASLLENSNNLNLSEKTNRESGQDS